MQIEMTEMGLLLTSIWAVLSLYQQITGVLPIISLLFLIVYIKCWEQSFSQYAQSVKRGMEYVQNFPGDSDGKEFACYAGDLGSISGSERSPREENGHPLHYSCLENPMDRGAWWAIVNRVTKSWI